MIIEALRNRKNFTEHEKTIAEFILKHPDEIQKMNSEALGKATFTSKSTVIRLCKKLNTTGYQELKKELYSELNEERLLGRKEISAILDKNSSYLDMKQMLSFIYKKAVDEVDFINNTNTIKRVMNHMIRMEKLEFFSTGLGYNLFEMVAYKFNNIGLECKVNTNYNAINLAENKVKSKTMVFVLSLSGSNPFVTYTAEILKRENFYIVGIVGVLSEEISKYCDEVIKIPIDVKQYVLGVEVVFFEQCVQYIFNLFLMAFIGNKRDEIMERQSKLKIDFDRPIDNEPKVSKKEPK